MTPTTITALHSGTLDVSAGGPAMSTYLTLKGLRATHNVYNIDDTAWVEEQKNINNDAHSSLHLIS